MLAALSRLITGSTNARIIKRYEKKVEAINALEPQIAALTDSNLQLKTKEFRERLEKGDALEKLLPEAFAVVREAAKRVLGQRHFDVQLMGGMALNDRAIAEMRTGEGKTLVATLAVYLNALPGKGVHVVTVNDYLAKRDSQWMGQVYRFLGLTTGVILHEMNDTERRAAYQADITYGTNNEFGFDYLRDNMKYAQTDMVQRPFWYAVVDEVDSILIDEARTPLIISGPSTDSSELYQKIDLLIPHLEQEDFEKDEKARTVVLTESGSVRIEKLLEESGLMDATGGLYDVQNISLLHHVNAALRAHKLFTNNVDYIVKDGKVVIIDEFTGRMMEGRRYGEGLHQAIEAKERVKIQRENQTLASITFQNYFRLYPKMAGMTGTALTEKPEFGEIYGLDVIVIPTNLSVKRRDHEDEFYLNHKDKQNAIIKLIEECHARQQPVLVGTVSIEKSEVLSNELKKRKIEHNILNAKYHEQEAEIVAQAGRVGAVTIATNMAGRGTDIQLGGNAEMRIRAELKDMAEGVEREQAVQKIRDEVLAARKVVREAGGLYVIGTERHESRRIDNQLRGRSGRQGDPGASKFFLALDDDLIRIFGAGKMSGVMQKMGWKEGQPIYDRWITKALEIAQRKVEERNFDIRKNLLKFDNVMNDQRKIIYEQRRELMDAKDLSDVVQEMRHDVVADLVALHIPAGSYAEHWDAKGLQEEVKRVLMLDVPIEQWAQEDGVADPEILARLERAADEHYAARVARFSPEVMRLAEKSVLLQILDQSWKEHLLNLEHLRQSIGLRGFGQRDPLNEYRREAFEMFEDLLNYLREQVTTMLMKLEVRINSPEAVPMPKAPQEMHAQHAELAMVGAETGAGFSGFDEGGKSPSSPSNSLPHRRAAFNQADPNTWGDTPRNNPCPCGSGKKYKHCHGRF